MNLRTWQGAATAVHAQLGGYGRRKNPPRGNWASGLSALWALTSATSNLVQDNSNPDWSMKYTAPLMGTDRERGCSQMIDVKEGVDISMRGNN